VESKLKELLRLIAALTRTGKLEWAQENKNELDHIAKLNGREFRIRFKYPLLAGDEGSDAEAAEFSAAGVIFTFYIGTEGFERISEILCAAYPNYREHNRKMTKEIKKMVSELRRHLDK